MAKTKAQLAKRTLQRLRVVSSNQDPSDADALFVKEEYDTLYEKWLEAGKVHWTNTDDTTEEIPEPVFDALVNIMAGQVAPQFGMPEPEVTEDTGQKMAASTVGYRDLRRYIRKLSDGLPTPATYY